MRRALIWSPIIAIGVLGLGAGTTHALFADTASVAGNGFTTGTLAAPTNPSATPACVASVRRITVSWTATASTFADGYDVQRSTTNGGPYTTIAHVVGRTTTSYIDTAVTAGVRYYYVVRATAGSWTSATTGQVSALATVVCL